jgi:hypothetical protein
MKTIIKILTVFLTLPFIISAFVFAQTTNYRQELSREMARLYENRQATINMEKMLENGFVPQEEFDGFRNVVDGEIDKTGGVVKRNMYISQDDYNKRIRQIQTELNGNLKEISKQYNVFQLQDILYGYLPKQQIKLLNYKLKQKNISQLEINAALSVLESVSYNIANGDLTPKNKRKLLISVYKTANKTFKRYKDIPELKDKFYGLTASSIARKIGSIKTGVNIPIPTKIPTKKLEPVYFLPLVGAERLRYYVRELDKSLSTTKARIALVEKLKKAEDDLGQLNPNMRQKNINAVFNNVISCANALYDDPKQSNAEIKNIFNSEFAKAAADRNFKKAEIIYKSGYVNINEPAAYHDFYVFPRDYSSNQVPRPVKTSIKLMTPFNIVVGTNNEIEPLEFLKELDPKAFDEGIKAAKKLAVQLRKNKIVEYLNNVLLSNIVGKSN